MAMLFFIKKSSVPNFREATLHLGEAEENFLNDSPPDLKDVYTAIGFRLVSYTYVRVACDRIVQ
jgi:hypothetical protein